LERINLEDHHNKPVKYLFLILFFSFCGVAVSGTVYHISPSGSNSNSGSVNSPWQTLSYACTKTISGDVIHITQGTYSEASQSILPVGVSIEGENKNTCIIGSSLSSYTILLQNSSSNTNGNQHISGITLKSNTPYTAYAGIGVINRGNVEIYDCNIADFNYYAVAFHNGESSTALATGNKIHDCTITNSSGYIGTYSSGDSKGSINLLSQDGLQIYNNTITVNRTDGKNGNCIDAVGGYLKDVKIYNNTLSKTFVSGQTWDFAIEIWNWLGGVEIYGNNITGSIDVVGVKKGSSAFGAWIHDNNIGQTSLKTSQSVRGILIEGTNDNILIERNYIHHVCSGVYMQTHSWEGVYMLPNSNIIIRYNIFDQIGLASGTGGWGFLCSQENTETSDIDDTVNNFFVYNNVFMAAGNATNWGVSVPDNGRATNVIITNNIIQGFDVAPVRMNNWARQSAASVDGLQIFNNIFYANGNSNNPSFVSGTVVANYTNGNNLTTAPPFVSSTDYHLTETRTGKYVSAGLTDKDGKVVANPPTIGAYEYGTVIVPPHSTLGKLIKSKNKLIIK